MERIGSYGILNIVAHPHPRGTYRSLFEMVGADPNGIRFRGDQYATLSPISETRNGVFSGRLAIWTEIDPNSNMIEKKTLKQSLLLDSTLRLPEGVGFNSKIFAFAFREENHRLYVELNNDEGQTVSIGTACKVFAQIFKNIRPDTVEQVDVHISTRRNAVEQVLAIPKIRKIEILLDMPNPDDLSEDKARLLKEIEDMRAKKLRSEITRASGQETLILSPRYIVMSELAKDNGYVTASGNDIDGEKIERSTKDYPNEIETLLGEDESRAFATCHIPAGGMAVS